MSESSAISVEQALSRLDTLQKRLTATNSSRPLREAVEALRRLLPAHEMEAVKLINQVTPLIAPLHECAVHLADNEEIHFYQADEKATGAYSVFDSLRFGYGYLNQRQVGSNIQIL